MRYSSPSIAAVVCGIFLLAALWRQPETPAGSNASAGIAQDSSKPATARAGTNTPVPESPGTETVAKTATAKPLAATSRAVVEARLAELVPEITFDQMPLRDVVTELTDLTGIIIYFDQEEIGDAIDPDAPVDVHVAAHSMSFETLFDEFILEPMDLVSVVRDRYLVVMSYEKYLYTTSEVVIYDCRDLLSVSPGPSETGMSYGGYSSYGGFGGQFQNYSGLGGWNPAGGMGPTRGIRLTTIADVMSVIQYTIRDEDYPWDDGSSYGDANVGTMRGFSGLLVVRTLPAIHKRIRQLLDSLRKAMKERERTESVYHSR